MSVLTVTISVDGKVIDQTAELMSIEIQREVNRVPSARLEFNDGDMPAGTFPLSDSNTFDLGREIEVKVRYEDEPSTEAVVFNGTIVGQRIEISGPSAVLSVEARDQVLRMTRGRKTATYKQMKDSDVFKKLVGQAGLRTGTVAATKVTQPELTQFNCTDWDFLLTRAEANGLLVVVEDGEVSVVPPPTSGAAAFDFTYGESIIGFDFEGDVSRQFASWEAVGWTSKTQKVTSHQAKPFTARMGNWDPQKVAKGIGFSKAQVAQPSDAVAAETTEWINARMVRNRLSFIRGRLKVQGVGGVKLLDFVDIKNVGDRFGGRAMVTGFSHQIADGVWTTDLQFGLPPNGNIETDGLVDAPAAAVIPPTRGLQTGVVVAFQEDPDKGMRLRVRLPVFGDGFEIWARLATPDGGKGRGFYFRPEPNDEVIVGFLNDDPRSAIVLGSMFGSKNTSPDRFGAPAKENQKKGFVTRSGMAISFLDADKPQLAIETPAKNVITLDDDKKSITIKDQHGNAVTLDDKGITLKSAKDLTLESTGEVRIKANSSVIIQGAKVDVK